jgi:iron complex outermembrane receptor protein
MTSFKARNAKHAVLRALFCAALLSSSSLVAVAPTASLAQDADGRVVERIVVTAQKRKEENIKVPIAVTAISGERVEDLTAEYLVDLGVKVPNVFMSMGDGASISPSISIRGLSSQSNINAGFPPAVGVYVDEVYQGRDPMFNTILNDIESVEVLRGPQGTLYGKNIIGGAVNITTLLPTDDFEAFGDVTVGNLNLLQVRGTVSSPIIDDKLGARVSAVHRHRDGFLHNSLTGEDLNDSEAQGGKIVLQSDFTEELTFILRADYFQEDGTSALETGPVSLPAVPLFAGIGPQNPDDNVVQLDQEEFAQRELYGFSGRFDYALEFADLTSITAYRQYRSDFHDDSDGLPIDGFDVGREENAENFSQEMRLTSADDEVLSWILGFYYYVENIENNRQIHVGTTFPFIFLPAVVHGFLAPFPGEAGRTESTIESSSYAFFGAATWQIAEQWRLAGGLRFTHEEKDFFYHQFHTAEVPGYFPGFLMLPVGSPIALFAPTIGPRFERYEDEQWTWDVSLSYDINPDNVVFAKYSTGFKAGGFQTDVVSFPYGGGNLGFLPEFVDNYEVGYKSYWFDDKVSLNIAAYYLEWLDKQEQIFTGLSFLIRNAASATSRGVEIELSASPIEELTFDANFAYLKAKYEEFPTNPVAEGATFPGLPKFSGSVGVQTQFPVFEGSTQFMARSDVSWRGGAFGNLANTITSATSVFLNLRTGLEDIDGKWGLYLWGRNVTDLIRPGGGEEFPFGITTRGAGLGQTYGLELRVAY